LAGSRAARATAALRARENPKIVSQQLGHTPVAITLDVCAAVMPGDQRDTVERVATPVVPPACPQSARRVANRCFRGGGTRKPTDDRHDTRQETPTQVNLAAALGFPNQPWGPRREVLCASLARW
jgi:hypothetical protein